MSDMEMRASLFLWLKEKSMYNESVFLREDLSRGYSFKGKPITLIGPRGIWIPEGFSIPISITTTTNGPYEDGFTDEGFLNYRYQGTDPDNRDNRGLREACRTRTPLVYFSSIKPGKYIAVWPVIVLEDHPEHLAIKVAIDPAYQISGSHLPTGINILDADSNIGVRRYITALTKQRLHQSAFREYVLDAYDRKCTMCRLQHAELLDAAHIIPDSDPDGLPVVVNGLSLCKIHHAAYDNQIIGVSPDYQIRVREDILEEIDGPMLKYGLQSLDSKKIILPHSSANYPDRDRLARRFELFLKAG